MIDDVTRIHRRNGLPVFRSRRAPCPGHCRWRGGHPGGPPLLTVRSLQGATPGSGYRHHPGLCQRCPGPAVPAGAEPMAPPAAERQGFAPLAILSAAREPAGYAWRGSEASRRAQFFPGSNYRTQSRMSNPHRTVQPASSVARACSSPALPTCFALCRLCQPETAGTGGLRGRRAGQQTCCGQPAYNSSDYATSVPLAKQLIAQFEAADCVVAPSGSCVGMICHHYPQMLEGSWRERAEQLAAKTFELTTFLHDIARLQRDDRPPVQLPTVTYHDSCAGCGSWVSSNSPGIAAQAVRHRGLELQQTEVCCGFRGTFCAKMPEISGKMVGDKLANAVATEARILAGGDLGCLLNIAGRASHHPRGRHRGAPRGGTLLWRRPRQRRHRQTGTALRSRP